MTQSQVVLNGERVRLRPLREEDAATLTDWLNEKEVRRWLHHSDREDASVDDFRQVYMSDNASQVALAIEDEGQRLIGVTRLIDIDRAHGRAEIAIIIGELSAWSRGYGTDVIRTFLRYAFREIGLRKVVLVTDADNARGIRCYEKCGFVHEGTLREHRLRWGEPIDMVVMGVLRDESTRASARPGLVE